MEPCRETIEGGVSQNSPQQAPGVRGATGMDMPSQMMVANDIVHALNQYHERRT
jgi:hypothetical protein